MNPIKTLVQKSFGLFGFYVGRVKKTPGDPLLDQFFQTLVHLGYSPTDIIDVGANHGHWTRSAAHFFPNSSFTLLEPQAHLERDIQDLRAEGRKIRWISAGASDKTGEMVFEVASKDDSSHFVENSSAEGQRIKVWALDDLLHEEKLPVPGILKIDTEGFDLKVLAGAKTLLGKTDFILIETAVVCPHFANTTHRVISHLADAGYDLMDITCLNRSSKDNLLWLTEMAFVRRGCSALADVTSYD